MIKWIMCAAGQFGGRRQFTEARLIVMPDLCEITWFHHFEFRVHGCQFILDPYVYLLDLCLITDQKIAFILNCLQKIRNSDWLILP